MMDPDTSKYQTTSSMISLKYGEDYDAIIESYPYYHFDFDKSTIGVVNIQENTVLNLYYDCEKCMVTFELNGGSSTDELSFEVNKGSHFKAPTITKDHYTISTYTNYQEIIYESTTFTPVWEATKYTITFVLVEGSSLDYLGYQKLAGSQSYLTTITYFDTLVLPRPINTKYTFQGWLRNGEQVAILSNVEENVVLYGDYDVELHTISFIEETNQSYQVIMAPSGTMVDAPYINPAYQIPGMGLVWYQEEDYQNQYLFDLMPSESITLYGRWEYDTGCGFLDFNTDKETIDSVEELAKFIDYIYFNYQTIPLTKVMTCANSVENALDQFEIASSMAEYRSNTQINFNASTRLLDNKITVSLNVSANTKPIEATMTTEATNKTPYNIVGYQEETALRDAFFDDFYIEKLTHTYEANTTNQLLYVVEHGYKPICSGNALTIYRKAKDVLRNIVSAEMGDMEKVERIFQYLVMNVKYDFNVLTAPESWAYYDAYFMEGVFLNHKAVCDGIAKAFVLLCNIEGIPCVEVSGNGHAWCEVKVKNHWFVIDATHGNLNIEGTNKSVIDYSEFLISKALKAEKGYISSEFNNLACDIIYPYFAKVETVNFTTYRFIVEKADDLAYLFKYAEGKETMLNGFALNFAIATDLDINELVSSAKAKYLSLTLHPFLYDVIWVYDDSLSYKVCKMMFN